MTSLPERVCEHAQRRPDAPALIWQQQQTTYAQLAAMMQSTRRRLDLLSPGPVGILTRKSSAAVGLVLGCLLAGRSVLIPSATQSSQTIGALFDQAGCAHVVTDHADVAQSHPDLIDLVISPDPTGPPGTPVEPGRPDPEAISFMLTTSGSTGTPKIVPLTYGAVDRFADWAARTFGMQPGSQVLNYAPLNFDLCLLDIWATVASGGCVVLADTDQATNGQYLADLLSSHAIEIVQAVPMFYELVTDAAGKAGTRFEQVRHVLFTGDAIRPTCLAGLPGLFPNARLYNIYGCTETNDSFVYEVTAPAPAPVPLGDPLPGVHSFLMAEGHTVLAGPGVGELYVNTPFQTPGYLSATQNNVEKFVTIAVDGVSNRYFKSGDLVRRHADGSLTLEGRTDFRIKIRGQQVNTQQVEQVLLEHENVIEAATVAVPDTLAGHLLHALVRRTNGSGLNSLMLRRFCAGRLPMSAIPSTWQITDAPLPKTSTGKVDRAYIKNSQTKVSEVDHTTTITQFIVDEFLPDISAGELAPDYDLLAGGVIDSLSMLKVIGWLEDRFELSVEDLDISPDNFRTVSAIDSFVRVNGPAGASQAGLS